MTKNNDEEFLTCEWEVGRCSLSVLPLNIDASSIPKRTARDGQRKTAKSSKQMETD